MKLAAVSRNLLLVSLLFAMPQLSAAQEPTQAQPGPDLVSNGCPQDLFPCTDGAQGCIPLLDNLYAAFLIDCYESGVDTQSRKCGTRLCGIFQCQCGNGKNIADVLCKKACS